MELCMTAQDPLIFSPPSSTKPFTTVTATRSSPHLPTPASNSNSLTFDLIIYDPSNDSALTHPWDLPIDNLPLAPSTSKAQLLEILRTHLPGGQAHGSSQTRRRPPKLLAVTLYWTFRGDILPLGPDDADWRYRNPITKTDLMERSELEWFLLKEMMVSSGGALKCYLAIKGEAPAAPIKKKKKTAYQRLFGSRR